MTENDKKLIARAEALHYTEWYAVTPLIRQAETDEARDILHTIQTTGNHLEEYHAGLL